MFKSKLWGMTFILLCLALAITACSSGGGGDGNNAQASQPSSAAPSSGTVEPVQEELPHVNLVLYARSRDLPDLQLVTDEINKYLAENTKLNATVAFKLIANADYETKMNAVAASGEVFDIAWTSDWVFNYQNNIAKGAFLALDDLLPQHAPKLLEVIPDFGWDNMRGPDGKIYGVPNQQLSVKHPGFLVQKRFADKYKDQIDVTKITNYEDWGKFFELIKQNEPGIIPLNSRGVLHWEFWGIDQTASVITHTDDPEFKVNYRFMNDEFLEMTKLGYEWYKKGYITDESITTKNLLDLDKRGNFAAKWDVSNGPNAPLDFQTITGQEMIVVRMGDPIFSGMQSTINAISKTSKNPERALMLLELINTDKALYNLMVYGIEGKHYEKIDDTYIKLIPGNPSDSAYYRADWYVGNTFNAYMLEGRDPNYYELAKQMNETSYVSPKMGFVFDNEPVKTENANIEAVNAEFEPLIYAAVDPDEFYPKYVEALKKAGVDKVVAEQQKQLDAWLKERGLK